MECRYTYENNIGKQNSNILCIEVQITITIPLYFKTSKYRLKIFSSLLLLAICNKNRRQLIKLMKEQNFNNMLVNKL